MFFDTFIILQLVGGGYVPDFIAKHGTHALGVHAISRCKHVRTTCITLYGIAVVHVLSLGVLFAKSRENHTVHYTNVYNHFSRRSTCVHMCVCVCLFVFFYFSLIFHKLVIVCFCLEVSQVLYNIIHLYV